MLSRKSKKQSTVAVSSTEAEVIVATETVRELMWIQNLVNSLDVDFGVPTLYCDSQPAIAIVNTAGSHGRSKHMDVKYKYLAERVESKDVRMLYVSIADNVADMMTKSQPNATFKTFSELINLTF